MKRRNFIQAASGTPLLASIGTVSAKNEGFSIPQINPPDDLQRFESHIIEFDMSEVKGVEFSEPDVTFVPPSITESGAYFSNSKGGSHQTRAV